MRSGSARHSPTRPDMVRQLKARILMEKTCTICKKDFLTSYPHSTTCSAACRKENARRNARRLHKKNMAARGPLAVKLKCKWCGKEFPRRHVASKYCSRKCYREAMKVVQARINNELSGRRKMAPAANMPTIRGCLGCGNGFESKWIGNRLCSNCMGAAERRSSAMN